MGQQLKGWALARDVIPGVKVPELCEFGKAGGFHQKLIHLVTARPQKGQTELANQTTYIQAEQGSFGVVRIQNKCIKEQRTIQNGRSGGEWLRVLGSISTEISDFLSEILVTLILWDVDFRQEKQNDRVWFTFYLGNSPGGRVDRRCTTLVFILQVVPRFYKGMCLEAGNERHSDVPNTHENRWRVRKGTQRERANEERGVLVDENIAVDMNAEPSQWMIALESDMTERLGTHSTAAD
ncbi:hypothetical protein JEQ12_019196 [Ovis aries]|uniref:Uncharacterized protein n=1 Tax=Ovis aries TaxID=9940 RepID=A0A836D2M1_SHEEP|nr:hypothetical protein JEQ12_019196 [Ovis aries]